LRVREGVITWGMRAIAFVAIVLLAASCGRKTAESDNGGAAPRVEGTYTAEELSLVERSVSNEFHPDRAELMGLWVYPKEEREKFGYTYHCMANVRVHDAQGESKEMSCFGNWVLSRETGDRTGARWRDAMFRELQNGKPVGN